MRSRGDLRRLNRLMGHPGLLAGLLAGTCPAPPAALAELGAGDGHLLAGVARRLGPGWRGTRALLVDRQPAVCAEARGQLTALGWKVELVVADVFNWFAAGRASGCEVLIANLFLHHFTDSELRGLLAQAAGEARVFAALEPRRSRLPLAASKLVGLIGCNAVTRHDAVVSVRAGFTGDDLSRLWTARGWELRETRAGLFSHLFMAQRGNGH